MDRKVRCSPRLTSLYVVAFVVAVVPLRVGAQAVSLDPAKTLRIVTSDFLRATSRWQIGSEL